MSWTFTTSGSAIAKAGTHANATIIADTATLAIWSNEAEGIIEQETNTDWTTTYSSLSASMKNALSEICSAVIAKKIIAYDPTGYYPRETDLLMNLNSDIETKGINKLNVKPDTLKTP